MLSDLLNYDKIENGQLQLELTEIPFWRLVEMIVQEFKLSAAKKSIDLRMEFTDATNDTDVENAGVFLASEALTEDAKDVKVVVDVIRLTLVLRNLLSNAIKFTPEHRSVRVSVSWCREQPAHSKKNMAAKTRELTMKNGEKVMYQDRGSLLLSVQDSGAGLTGQQINMLFRDGVQFNPNELQAGKGSGLGLFIAKGIAEQHDGSLQAKSDGLGKGATFQMELPLFYAPSPKCATETTLRVSGTGGKRNTDENVLTSMHVLVVDDAQSNRRLLGRLLKNRGHFVEEAEDGLAAVQLVRAAAEESRSPYDLILMDSEMPLLSGPQATKTIREEGHLVFVVGVTGNLLPEDVHHFKACGADAILPKPFSMTQLDDLLRQHLRRTHSQTS